MRAIWVAAALVLAGCVGPPLPADRQALEAELRVRAGILRDTFASFRAHGTLVIEGPDRLKLNWRAEAVRGQWARLALSSWPASEPVLEVRARAGEGLAVRISPPGSAARLYAAPSDDLSALAEDKPARAAAEWLIQFARDPQAAMPSPSDIQVTDDAVLLEFAGAPLVSRVALRRADGMPMAVDTRVHGDPSRTCVMSRRRGERALRLPGAPLALARDVDAAVIPCCNGKPLVSFRLSVVSLATGPTARWSRWAETARPFERIVDDRWIRPAIRQAEAVRDRAARACPASP